MKKNRKRIFFISMAYAETAGFCGFIETAHVPADSNCFVFTKTHKTFHNENGFFAVAEGELIINGIIRNFFPNSAFVFYVAVAYGVKVCLADVVKKSADCNAFAVGDSVFCAAFFKKFVNVKAVLNKSAFKSGMIFGGSRSDEKVALGKPFKKLFGTGAFNVFFKNFNKLLFC